MSQESYKITTTVCMILAILSALLYEKSESYQLIVIAVGGVAAVVSAVAYILHHWPNVETRIEENSFDTSGVVNELKYVHMGRMVEIQHEILAEVYREAAKNISNHESMEYWIKNVAAARVGYGEAPVRKIKIRSERVRSKGFDTHVDHDGFNMPEHFSVQ